MFFDNLRINALHKLAMDADLLGMMFFPCADVAESGCVPIRWRLVT